MVLHVLFTKDGTPAWIGTEPLEGSEAVEGVTVEFLARHRRSAKAAWVLRPDPVVAEPTAEDIAAREAAAFQAAQEDRDRALREALAEEADPLFFRWQRDEASKEEWLAAVAAVKSRFPKPKRP